MSLLEKIQQNPLSITFQEVIAHIDSTYEFTPTRFSNGNTVNESGQNNGSCKIFSFALLLSLTQDQTLELFGEYYRIDTSKPNRRTTTINETPKPSTFDILTRLSGRP